jgi:PAS domain S-box-containing protein
MVSMSYQVLLVEDRMADAELIQEALRQSTVSCEVRHVRRLADALQLSVNTRFDVVLMNLFLSDSQGLDTYVAMRSHAASLPLILIADSASQEISMEAMKKGAQDFLHIDEISPAMLGKSVRYAIERKHHERELRLQKEFYENLLREANVWVEALDRQGNVILWNKGAEKISGYSAEAVMSNRRRWELLYPDPSRRQEMSERYDILLQNERGIRNLESEILTAAGQRRVISWNSNLIRGEGNEIVGCMLVGNDVTDQLGNDLDILEGEQRFRVLSELTTDYVYSATIDAQGRVSTRWVEGAFERITGYAPDAVIGRQVAWADVILRADMPSPETFARMIEQDWFVLEYRIRRQDGSIRWLRDSMRPIRDRHTGQTTGLLGAVKDITAEKEARQSEYKARRALTALIESAHDYAFLLAPDGTILEAGTTLAGFLQSTPEELQGKTLFDFLPDSYPEESLARLRELCVTHVNFEYTTEFMNHHILVRGTPVFDEDGNLTMVVVFGRDVTEERQAQEILRREEEKFRGIIENSTDGIVLMDGQGKLIEWNFSMERITGIPRAEALSMSYWDVQFVLTPEEDRRREGLHEEMRQSILSYLQSGEATWLNQLAQHWIQRPSGERRFIEMVSFRISSSFGMLTGSVSRDITEMKLAERSLEEKNRLLQTLIQAIPDIVYFKDAELRIAIVNQAYADFSGMPIDALIGKREDEFMPPGIALQYLDGDREVMTKGVTVRREESMTLPGSDAPQWFETLKTPLVNANGRIIGLIGVSRDITERKLAALRLEEQNKELRERNEELDTFTHSVAHDLKNPLSLILGYADMVQYEGGSFTAQELNDYMGSILFNGRKMIGIINSLLLLASVRKEDVVFERIDMSEIVGDAMRRLNKLITDSDTTITLPGEWPSSRGYAPWIEEVWVNYIGNAIKHGGRGRHVVVTVEDIPDGMQRYSVTDDGPGIPAARLSELFLPFTRLSQAKIEGHGLGLSIVKRIVEKTGGQVDVRSIEGEGSTFSFTLPAA